MAHLVILAHSRATAAALTAWHTLLADHSGDDNQPPVVHLLDANDLARQGGVPAFQRLVTTLDAEASRSRSGELLVVADSIRPAEMSAVSETGNWNHLLAMAILTFPDVRWAFAACTGDTTLDDGRDGREFPHAEHNLTTVVGRPVRDTLFDATGLRDWVRRCTNLKLRGFARREGQSAFILTERPRAAAAIDEELDYAYLHGYTAYRYGFRADAITTWDLMADRFSGRDGRTSHGYQLLLEDMRLSFPDKPAAVHLSRLATGQPGPSPEMGTRDFHCPLLAVPHDDSQWRFMITTGQTADDAQLVQDNRKELRARKGSDGDVRFKPLGGMCEMWKTLGLPDARYRPPTAVLQREYEGHGSPGKLAHVAATLLRRAGTLADSAKSAADYARVAVLACDAAELLGGKTPTLTLTAIALKQECEVRAECTFVGTGFHVGLTERLQELQAEVKSVARWFHQEVSRRAESDLQVSIINRLALAFRDAGRVEEERRCLIELRRLNRKLSRPAKWWRFDQWMSHGVLAYGEWLLKSFGHLAGTTALFVAAFAALMHVLSPGDLTKTGGYVMGSFFGGAPYTDASVAIRIVSWFAVVIGLFHLGVLISFIYSLISRK